MATRQKNPNRDRESTRPTPGTDDSGDDAHASAERIDELRNRASRLLNSADDAISRVLSSDSEQFLRDTRQSGGQ